MTLMPTTSNSPAIGFGCMLKGFQLITQPRIRQYVLIPLLINIVLFSLFFVLLWHQLEAVNLWLDGLLPTWLSWLQWLVKPILFLLGFVIGLFSFAWVGNIIGGYFNGLLSLAVEQHLTGKHKQVDVSGSILKQIGVEIGQVLLKLRYSLAWLIIILIISFIPVVNLISPLLWFLYASWLLAFEYLENPMSNHGLNFIQTRQCIRQQRFLVFGFGSGAMLLMLIPLVNFFTMPAGVAGATYMWLNHFPQHEKED